MKIYSFLPSLCLPAKTVCVLKGLLAASQQPQPATCSWVPLSHKAPSTAVRVSTLGGKEGRDLAETPLCQSRPANTAQSYLLTACPLLELQRGLGSLSSYWKHSGFKLKIYLKSLSWPFTKSYQFMILYLKQFSFLNKLWILKMKHDFQVSRPVPYSSQCLSMPLVPYHLDLVDYS